MNMRKSTPRLSSRSKILQQAANFSRQCTTSIPKFHALQYANDPEETGQWVGAGNDREDKLKRKDRIDQGKMCHGAAALESPNDNVVEVERLLKCEQKSRVDEMAQKADLRDGTTDSRIGTPPLSYKVSRASFLHLKQFAHVSATSTDGMFEQGEKLFHVGFLQQRREEIVRTFPKRAAALLRMHKQLEESWQKTVAEEKNKSLSEDEYKMLQECMGTTGKVNALKNGERMIEIIHEKIWPMIANSYREFSDACCYGKLCLTKVHNFKPDLYEEAVKVVKQLTQIHLDIESMLSDQVDYYLKRAEMVIEIEEGEMNAIQQTYMLSKYDNTERDRCLSCVQRLAHYYHESRALILKCLILPTDDVDLTEAALKMARNPMDLLVIAKQMHLD
uniref:BAR domain-containing protein n=1 Tax=Trichuris muris TaxID=70415 RepID=A0A5S6QQD5_TRIMR